MHVCVCVSATVHTRLSEFVCGLRGDCRGAIDSLNPILFSAGEDTDEN